MPSVSSSSRPKVWLSSTVITPSLPTLSIASAIISPIEGSPAEMEAVEAICSLVSTSLAILESSSLTRSTADSMPRFNDIGFAPAATLRRPSRTSACAKTVAVVVPSPATSSVFLATSLTSSAPIFSHGSSSSISLAIETPSLVIVGAPHFFSKTTLRPLGPRVTLTASASWFMPRSRPRRASSSNAIIFEAMLFLSFDEGLSTRTLTHNLRGAHVVRDTHIAGKVRTVNDDEAVDMRAHHKMATREAISTAALRLAVEHGPEGLALVRVRDIADAAGVSPRTYNNYFSSREEAICAIESDRARRLGKALLSRPAGEPLDQAITAAVLEHYGTAEPDRVGLRMIMCTPELEAEALKAFTTAEEPLAAAIAERLGADRERDLYPKVMAATVAGAVRVAARHWLLPGNTESFATVLERALGHALSAR